MEDIIKITLGDWQYNAGIVGMYNILKHSGKDIIEFTSNYVKGENKENVNSNFEICFPIEYLDNFANDYFDYLIDTYINQISYGKIVGFKVDAENIIDIEDEDFSDGKIVEAVEKINKYIKNCLHYYIKSASYKAALELIPNSDVLVKEIIEIKAIKISKKNKPSISEIKNICNKLVKVINSLEGPAYRKYIGGKNVIYSLIKRNWDKVSILNAQVKEKDILKEFENYFVFPTIEYMKTDKAKYKYNCFLCDSKIKDMKNNLSFLTNTGFAVNKKSSHIWNFQNDIAICDVCKLVYTCMPAGFVYGFDKGVFINSNLNIKALTHVNSKLKNNVLEGFNNSKKSMTYKGVVEAIIAERSNQIIKYELSDVQVVFFENDKYIFSILSENILNVIYESRTQLNYIKNGSFVENKKNYYLYEEVLKRLLNNQNLFSLINRLMHYYISNKRSCFFSLTSLECILRVNLNYLKGVGLMSELNNKDISTIRNYGWHVRMGYDSKGAVKKIDGISYSMLNALKTSNVNAFMDLLIRCYMYIGKEIPKKFIECLSTEEEFKTIGYAFILGFNGVNFEKNEEKDNNKLSVEE